MADQTHNIDVNIREVGGQQAQRRVDGLNDSAQRAANGGLRDLSNRADDLAGRFGNLPGPLGEASNGISNLVSGARALTSGVGGTTLAVGGFAVGLAAVAVAAAHMGEKIALAADDAAEMADKMGVTIERLEALKVVAEDNSGSAEGYAKALDKIAKSMTKLDEENPKAVKAMASLGLSFEDMQKLSPDEQIQAIVKAYENLGRSQEALAASTLLAGGGFRDLIPMVKALAEDAGAATRRSEEFGNVIGIDLVEMGGRAEDANRDLSEAFGGLVKEFSKGAGDPWIEFKKSAAQSINWIRQVMSEWRASQKEMNAKAARGVDGGKGGTVGLIGGFANTVSEAMFGKRKEVLPTVKLNRKSTPNGKSWDEINQEKLVKIEEAKVEAKGKAEAASRKAESAAESAARKAASAAESEAKRQIAATEAAKKANEDAEISSERKLLSAERANKETMARFETERGNQRFLDDAVKKSIVDNAKKEDVLNDQEETLRSMLEFTEKINSAAEAGVKGIRSVGERVQAQADYEKNTKGMSRGDRETYDQRLDAEAALKSGQEKVQGAFNDSDWSAEAYEKHAKEQARLREEYEITTGVITDNAAQRKTAEDDWLGGFSDGVNSYLGGATSMRDQMSQLGETVFGGMEDALTQFVTTGKMNFKDFTKSILADIAKIIVKQMIMKALGGFGSAATATSAAVPSSGILGAIGNAFGGGQANGGAWNKGVQMFANGGVVNRTTPFGMAGGKFGVMGEAGPEAIMPLKRGANGQLGVQMTGGGGGGITISTGDIIVQGGQTNEETAAALRKEMISLANNAALKQIQKQSTQNGGMLYNR